MSSRIRYSKQTDGTLLSKQTFTNGEFSYKVFLNPQTLSFIILNVSTNTEEMGGSSTNIQSLKINAKKALNNCGVDFKSEKRKRINV